VAGGFAAALFLPRRAGKSAESVPEALPEAVTA